MNYESMTKKELVQLLTVAMQENKLLKKETGRTIKEDITYPFIAVSLVSCPNNISKYVEVSFDLKSNSAKIESIKEFKAQYHMALYELKQTLAMKIDKQEEK